MLKEVTFLREAGQESEQMLSLEKLEFVKTNIFTGILCLKKKNLEFLVKENS